MKTLVSKKISVTKEHIAKATDLCNSNSVYVPECCPVALACQDAGLSGARVGITVIRFDGGSAILPMKARHFISAFDSIGADSYLVEPVEFDLSLEYNPTEES